MIDDNIETTNLKPASEGNNGFKVLPFKRVTPKVTAGNTPDPEIIKFFEKYLEAAKAGKIKFAGLATVDEEGVASTSWEPEDTTPQIISAALGAVNFLNYRFANSAAEGGAYTDKYED